MGAWANWPTRVADEDEMIAAVMNQWGPEWSPKTLLPHLDSQGVPKRMHRFVHSGRGRRRTTPLTSASPSIAIRHQLQFPPFDGSKGNEGIDCGFHGSAPIGIWWGEEKC
jgi:hypothetical protein